MRSHELGILQFTAARLDVSWKAGRKISREGLQFRSSKVDSLSHYH
jgi:hypothetical protein